MFFNIPAPKNEPVLPYAPGSEERELLQKTLKEMHGQQIEIPAIIGGKEVLTGNMGSNVCPHDHQHVLCNFHRAGKAEIGQAIDAALKARRMWEEMPFYDRAAIFLKAAELLATKYRPVINAATMLSQSKSAHQAEIDSACELIDFWRFNPYFAQQIYEQQPPVSPQGEWNSSQYRALEGFVFAITPFNFTSIAGNLPTSPALMGNTVVWKPAGTAVYSGYFIMKVLMEAGLPDGVINFIPGQGAVMGDMVMDSPDLAGIHFTGSTGVFNHIWKYTAQNLENYKAYPRIVGETGGKDFIFAHPSADVTALAVASFRGAYEYQGQKCSAASRIYIPESLYGEWLEQMKAMMADIKQGDVMDFGNFVNAVIDKHSFDNIKSYIEHAKASNDASIIAGGGYDDSKGYFIKPTLIKAENPHCKSMQEEIFGPVLTVYVYKDSEFEKTLELCDSTSPYGLTGAIFSRDREATVKACRALRHAAGNFYINDKPTGAVVGQQPFGGARGSGTNDKAGSAQNLMRWTSARSIKENFVPPTNYKYPFLQS